MAGYSRPEIEELVRDLPDPIDTQRDGVALMNRGLTMDRLSDRRGGSP